VSWTWGLGAAAPGGLLPITSSRMAHLWDALVHAYPVLGFEKAAGGDAVFAQLVLARIIEPSSKLGQRPGAGGGRCGAGVVSHHQPAAAGLCPGSWREKLSAACAARAGLGPASLVLYDVSTLYFVTDAADGFREPGFSKERRLDPRSPSAC
jgi:hypothetical protein